MTVHARGEHHRLGSGPYLMPQHRFTSAMDATDLTIVALDHAWVQDYAGELLQQEDFELRFTGTTPYHREAADHWSGAVTSLHEVLAHEEAATVPLIRTEVQRRVATALLFGFPSTFADHPVSGETTARLTGAGRRAVAYIGDQLS